MIRHHVVSGRLVGLFVTMLPSAALSAQNTNWPMYNGDYQGTRYSTLEQITAANANTLQKVCTFDTGEVVSSQSGPVIVDGVLYLTTDTSTYAVDARTCTLKWRTGRSFSPATMLGNNHGVAHLNGRLFRVAGDVHAYSIDASSGKILWDVQFGNQAGGEVAPMAPIAWNNLVFVGNAGGDNIGVTGHAHALDAQTGREVWRFENVPDTGAVRNTWPNRDSVPPTGGGMWSSFSLDPERGVLYIPAGNPAPDFIPELRPGENLYTNSIIAVDAKTGKFLGYIQVVKDDFHDWDVSATPAVITTRAGKPLLALAGKDGLLHGITRANNKFNIVYSVPTTTRENTTARFTHLNPTRFCPGTQGGTEWNGPAFSPQLNLIYVGAVDWCANIQLVPPDSIKLPLKPDFSGQKGGGFGKFDPKEQWKGWLTAIEADSGTVRWKYQAETPILAAVTTTAGNIVITGDMNGNLIVLDARNGKVVYQNSTGAPIGAGIVTYNAGGKQYIAVAGGKISPIWPLPEKSSRVSVYALQ